MTDAKLYLKKLENDLNERIYDLFIEHLKSAHSVIARTEKNKENLTILYGILQRAIEKLKKETTKSNQFFFFRYRVLVINYYLSYVPNNEAIKKEKLEILNEFSKGDYDLNEKIPLRSQMTEIRITYDVKYLYYLIEKQFIPKKMWDKALYCLLAVELIEPDHKDIKTFYDLILSNIEKKKVEFFEFEKPNNAIIILDTNIVLSKVLGPVGDFKIPQMNHDNYEKMLNELNENNKFVITPSVLNDLNKSLEFTLSKAKELCEKNNKFNYEEISHVLNKRFSEIINKYYLKINIKNDTKEIEAFYSNFLEMLQKITLDKIEHKSLSQKLKKLSMRDGLLPEKGDMILLKEAIEIRNSSENKNLYIISNDKDLYLFNKEINDKFKIKIIK